MEAKYQYLDWVIEGAAELEDGETGTDRCIEDFCLQNDLSDKVCLAAQQRAFKLGALEAGIPLAVVEGKRKLRQEEIPQDVLDSPYWKEKHKTEEGV